MTRFGPLQALAPALVVGDPTRSHLRLDHDGIRYVSEGRIVDTYQWVDVNQIEIDLPKTWFRYPGATAGVAMSLIALLTHDTPDFRTKPGTATVTHESGETRLRIDTHHLIGYWQGAVAVTQRLLDRLLSDFSSRALLKNPDKLVKTVAASTRWFRQTTVI